MFAKLFAKAFAKRWFLVLTIATLIGGVPAMVWAGEMSEEEAWKILPRYQHGEDMAALLVIDRAVIASHSSAEARAACAARLAAVLASAEATTAAKEYACFKLRDVGTVAQVPLLAGLLEDPKMSQPARYALDAITGPEATAALRGALTKLNGDLQVGVINSVAARGDMEAVPILERLADSSDPQVVTAALWALGNLAGPRSTAFLMARAESAQDPLPKELAVPLLRCANECLDSGQHDVARKIFTRLSHTKQPSGIRRAALEGLLRLEKEASADTIVRWLTTGDADQCAVAAAKLATLPETQLGSLLDRLPDLNSHAKLAVLETAVSRQGKQLIPTLTAMVTSDRPELRNVAIRALGTMGDASVIPLLIDQLAAEETTCKVAQEALANLPRKEVTAALLAALDQRPEIRPAVIAVLGKIKCYEAIDPLIRIAAQANVADYQPALEGLRTIADPDDTDIPRLINLLLRAKPGQHRDDVERTIVLVCDKSPPGTDRAAVVLKHIEKLDRTLMPAVLPLLGRLGGAKALERVSAAMNDPDPVLREAAIRALCNWPTAEVADQLLRLATTGEKETYRRWALRAYIRVVTLPSDRPEAETLSYLKKAMELASVPEDRQLVLRRAATVRTMETVEWIASYLNQAELAQAACESLVELAHHRFLRQPNMERFGPILEKVEQVSTDPSIVEQAKRYRLGL